jgi:hypothetical protein
LWIAGRRATLEPVSMEGSAMARPASQIPKDATLGREAKGCIQFKSSGPMEGALAT